MNNTQTSAQILAELEQMIADAKNPEPPQL